MEFIKDNELDSKILNTLKKVLNFEKYDTENLEIRYTETQRNGKLKYECRVYCKKSAYNSRYSTSNYELTDDKNIIFNHYHSIELSEEEYNYLFYSLSKQYLKLLNNELDEIQREIEAN